MSWLVFGIGSALGVLGVIYVLRYFLWMRLVWLIETMGQRAENTVGIFQSGLAKNVADVKDMETGWQKLMGELESRTRWLWPGPDIWGWVSPHLTTALTQTIEFGKQLTEGGPLDWGKFQEEMSHAKEVCENFNHHFRESANNEIVRATAAFSLGALIVGLFHLLELRQ
jgi:hypothetical protein